VKTIIAAPFKDAISVGMKGEGLPGFEYLTNITSRVSRWSTGIHSRQTPPLRIPLSKHYDEVIDALQNHLNEYTTLTTYLVEA
jgi:hypothetical protein